VESIVGEQQLAEADDVARYEKYLELLRDLSGNRISVTFTHAIDPASGRTPEQYPGSYHGA
jgi:hypothetical protein